MSRPRYETYWMPKRRLVLAVPEGMPAPAGGVRVDVVYPNRGAAYLAIEDGEGVPVRLNAAWDGEIRNLVPKAPASGAGGSGTQDDGVVRRILPAAEFAKNETDDDIEWAIPDLWPRRSWGFLSGADKVGKSFLLVDLALALASGQPFLRRLIERAFRVVLLSEELPKRDLAARLTWFSRGRDLDWRKLDLLYLGADTGIRIDTAEGQTELRAYVREYRPEFLILDPLTRIFDGDENSAMEVRRVLRVLDEMRREFDVSVLVAHHDRKPPRAQGGRGAAKATESDALRGSGDLRAWYATLWRMTKSAAFVTINVTHRNAPSISIDDVRVRVGQDDDGVWTGRIVVTPPITVVSGGQQQREAQQREGLVEAVRDALAAAGTNGLNQNGLRQQTGRSGEDVKRVIMELADAGLVTTRDGQRLGSAGAAYVLTELGLGTRGGRPSPAEVDPGLDPAQSADGARSTFADGNENTGESGADPAEDAPSDAERADPDPRRAGPAGPAPLGAVREVRPGAGVDEDGEAEGGKGGDGDGDGEGGGGE